LNPPASAAGIPLALADFATRTDGLRTDAVEFTGARGDLAVRALVRPSGTEPKVKVYVEVVTPVGSTAEVSRTCREASDLASRVAVGLLA